MTEEAGASVRRGYSYRDGGRLALWAQIGLIYAAAADLVVAVTYVLQGGAPDADSYNAWNGVCSVLLSLSFVLFIPVLIWLHRVSANARSFRPDLPGSIWGVYFWYFIPFASLIMPYRVMAGIWRASEQGGAGAPAKPSLVLLQVWWGLLLLYVPALVISDLLRGSPIQALPFVDGAAVAVLLFLIVGRIQAMQAATYAAGTSPLIAG